MYAISNAAMEEEIRSRGEECASKDTKMTLARQLCKLRRRDFKKNKPQAPAPIMEIADALARAFVSPMIKLDIGDSATSSDGDGEGRAEEFDEAVPHDTEGGASEEDPDAMEEEEDDEERASPPAAAPPPVDADTDDSEQSEAEQPGDSFDNETDSMLRDLTDDW